MCSDGGCPGVHVTPTRSPYPPTSTTSFRNVLISGRRFNFHPGHDWNCARANAPSPAVPRATRASATHAATTRAATTRRAGRRRVVVRVVVAVDVIAERATRDVASSRRRRPADARARVIRIGVAASRDADARCDDARDDDDDDDDDDAREDARDHARDATRARRARERIARRGRNQSRVRGVVRLVRAGGGEDAVRWERANPGRDGGDPAVRVVADQGVQTVPGIDR